MSRRIPASDKDKQPTGKGDKDKADGSDPNRMTGPRLAGLYQQLKNAEKNGDAVKAKHAEAATNGSRGESSQAKH